MLIAKLKVVQAAAVFRTDRNHSIISNKERSLLSKIFHNNTPNWEELFKKALMSMWGR